MSAVTSFSIFVFPNENASNIYEISVVSYYIMNAYRTDNKTNCENRLLPPNFRFREETIAFRVQLYIGR